MPKIDNLSAKLTLLSSEKELFIPEGTELMGQRLGGLSMFSNVFKRGYGDAVFGSDENGIWLGAADFADAPFRVDMDGNLVATAATITGVGKNFVSTLVWTATDTNTATWASGTIKTSDGTSYSIAGGNTGDIGATTYIYLDPATSITVLQTSTTATDAAGNGKILIAIVQVGGAGQECIIDVVGSAGTTIDGDRILTGSIVADRLDVSILSAVTADLGAITAGTVTGATIRTAASGARFEISGSKGASYAAGGAELTRLDGSGLGIFGTGGNVVYFKDSAAGTRYGVLSYSSGLPGLYLAGDNSADLILYGDDEIYVISDKGIYHNAGAGDNHLFDEIVRCKKIQLNNGQNEGDIESIQKLKAYDEMVLEVGGNNKILFDATNNGDDLSMFPAFGDFYATGTKHFRIPHPDDPTKKWIQYASVESPEVALKVRGKAKLKNGKVIIVLDRHWKLVTVDHLTTLQLTPLGDCEGLFSSQLTNESFTVRELQDGISDVEFMWELTATRKGYASFNPEQTLEEDADKIVEKTIYDEENVEVNALSRTERLARYAKIDELIEIKYVEQTEGRILPVKESPYLEEDAEREIRLAEKREKILASKKRKDRKII